MYNKSGKLTKGQKLSYEQRRYVDKYGKIPREIELAQVRAYKKSPNRLVEMEVL